VEERKRLCENNGRDRVRREKELKMLGFTKSSKHPQKGIKI